VRAFGLVAETGLEDRIVGHALYIALEGDRAEVAFAVADDYQGRGLGTILLGHLAKVAAANGIHVFEAEVLPDNYRMLEVFRESGFPVEVRAKLGISTFVSLGNKAGISGNDLLECWEADPRTDPKRPPCRDHHQRGWACDPLRGCLPSRGGGWLRPEEVEVLLSCYRLPVVNQRVVTSPEQAGRAA